MLGFIAAEGIRQGLITVGTIAWNVVTDFDLAILVPIVSLLHLIEFIVLVKKNDDIERSEELTGMVRKILAAVTIFALAMGISLESVVIVCGSAVLVMSLIYVLIPLSPREQVEPSSRWNRFCRRGIAWCALACTIAIVLRGFGHLGESAAIATVALALAGISLRWMKPRDLVTILLNVTSSMLVLGLAFIIAALWNLFANHHAELESLVRLLGIPQVAIFPVAILLLFGLTYWLNPLISVVVATPVLYLGLEQPALAPVWTAPVIAILLSTAMCLRYRLRSVRVVGVAGSGLLVVVILAAFASERLVGHEFATRFAPSSLTEGGSKVVALADGRIVASDELDADRWFRARTFGRAPLRPNHGGSALDVKRRQILMFGADTHFRDWNNAVTAFDLRSQTWIRHYRPSPRYAMRADASGNRISGINRVLPWPMHTYDGVVYHPGIDALVVAAAPLHSLKAVPNGRFDPTWIYDLTTRRWRMGPITGDSMPRFFGGTAVYDSRRDTIFSFNTVSARFIQLPIGKEAQYFVPELFELGIDLGEWRKVSDAPRRPVGRSNAEFDSRRDEIVVFAPNAFVHRIRVYAHDQPRRTSGTWRTHRFSNEGCDSDALFAVAHDGEGRFLMLPGRGRSKGNLTCVYDKERNIVVPVNSAVLPYLGMNFNLHYDPASRLFVLVSGRSLHGARASVRLIKLDQASPSSTVRLPSRHD